MKIIVDTNIWISYFISKSFNELIDILLNDYFEIAFSNELLNEIKEVTSRKKFEKMLDKEKVDELINIIISRCNFFITPGLSNVCRDENDNFLLSLAETFKADYLVTGDYDLLDMGSHKSTKIVNWPSFLEILKKR